MSIQQPTQGNRPADPLLSNEEEDAAAEPEPEQPKPPPFTVQGECWAMFSMGWPMVISFACRMAMASTDTAFVGHLDNTTIGTFLPRPFSAESYLAAASLSDMVVSILIVPPLAFNQVLNSLVGQALGSGNLKMAGTWLQLSIFFLSITYIPFLVLQYFYVGRILHLLGFDADVCELANHFARWSLFWPIPNGIYQCMRFYFQAQGMSRPAMYNNAAFVLVNGVLNWLLVFGGPFQYLQPTSSLHWTGFGFVGASMSISTSRSLQPLFYWLYMCAWKGLHKETWPGLSLDFLRRDRVCKFFAQALPYIGTLIFQSVSGQVTTLLIAQLGPLAIAASATVAAVSQIASGALSAAFTAVAAVRVGYHLGAGNAYAAKMAMWIVVGSCTVISVVTCLVLWPLAVPICDLVSDDPVVRPVAASILVASLVQAGIATLVGVGTSGVLGGQGRTFIITLLSFGFELPTSIGGMVIMVLVLKWRMPHGLLDITWVNAAIALFELIVLAILIIPSNWTRYAREAQTRQEADVAAAAAEAEAAPASDAIPTVAPLDASAVVVADRRDENAPAPA